MRILVVLLVMLSIQCQAEERGIASVFSDRRVACPPYHIDPYKVIGIAHKTLKCGTLVEITNQINGKKIKAPVIDIGPCTSNYCLKVMPKRIQRRLIDMLPRVAQAIGSSGLTPIKLAIIK